MDINKYVSLAIGIAVIAIVENDSLTGRVSHWRYGSHRGAEPSSYNGRCCPG